MKTQKDTRCRMYWCFLEQQILRITVQNQASIIIFSTQEPFLFWKVIILNAVINNIIY